LWLLFLLLSKAIFFAFVEAVIFVSVGGIYKIFDRFHDIDIAVCMCFTSGY